MLRRGPPWIPVTITFLASPAVPSAVSTLTDDLLKYYQHVTRAVLGDDPQLMKVSEGLGICAFISDWPAMGWGVFQGRQSPGLYRGYFCFNLDSAQ